MTTFNTGNPLGSTDVYDRYDNSENLDNLSNGPLASYPDRLGVSRKSWKGMELDFSAFLAASGFELPAIEYTGLATLVIDRPTQLIFRTGFPDTLYGVKSTESFPATLTGTWATDEARLVVRSDGDLRQDLAISTGAHLVGYGVRTVAGKLADFYTPYDEGAVGDGVADDTAALQAFFNGVNTAARQASCAGNFRITSALTCDLANSGRSIVFDARITVDAPVDTFALTFRNCRGSSFPGGLMLTGQGSGASRTTKHGVLFDNCFRAHFGRVVVLRVQHTGADVRDTTGFSTFMRFDHLSTFECGYSLPGPNGFASTWSSPVNTGSASIPSQRTEMSVAAIPPGCADGDCCVIGGEVYKITAVDTLAGKITIYPWIDPSAIPGGINFYSGAGLEVRGPDVGCVTIGAHVASNCAVAKKEHSLYPGHTGYASAEFCGIGLSLVRTTDGAAVAGGYGTYYCEGNTLDVLKGTTSTLCTFAIDTAVFSLSKVVALAPRAADGSKSVNTQRVTGLRLPASNNAPLVVGGNSTLTGATTATATLEPSEVPMLAYRSNTMTVTLNADEALVRAFGRSSVFVLAQGSSINGGPTGTYTFNPQAGYTVNGGASAAFSNMRAPTLFSCRLVGTNWEVRIVGGRQIIGSTTYDPPSIATGSRGAAQTISVPGAALGDFVQVSLSIDTQGLDVNARVSAADTVTFVYANATGAAVDLASHTVYALVTKRQG